MFERSGREQQVRCMALLGVDQACCIRTALVSSRELPAQFALRRSASQTLPLATSSQKSTAESARINLNGKQRQRRPSSRPFG